MSKLKRKVTTNENKCKELHQQMNMRVGPTRLQPLTLYVIPDLDPMQKQLNRLENQQNRAERVAGRRAWKDSRKGKA